MGDLVGSRMHSLGNRDLVEPALRRKLGTGQNFVNRSAGGILGTNRRRPKRFQMGRRAGLADIQRGSLGSFVETRVAKRDVRLAEFA